jgi:hypothetical protein
MTIDEYNGGMTQDEVAAHNASVIAHIAPDAAEYTETMEVEDAAKKPVKTLGQWNASRTDLDHFLQIGDFVDQAMADYALGVLPPAYCTSNMVQIGEPYSHVDGKETYTTFYRSSENEPWEYRGHCHLGNNRHPRHF